jgi:Ca-activated chloride channel family protein
MNPLRTVLWTAIAMAFVLAAPSAAYADGIVVPEPPICEFGPCPFPIPVSQLAIEYHRVNVRIDNQVAVTHVDQVFRNDNDWTVEGTYIFPLPKGAAVSDFTLWIDGEPVQGEVLTKEEARQVYEEIVRTLRDPALLEYVDQGAVQASIFPIEPGQTRRIELEYQQVLVADNGLLHYRYPLNTEKFSTQPLEEVSVVVEVISDDAIRAVYSPSHQVAISREDDFEFRVGYEESFVTPDKDFELYYSLASEDIGLNLLSFRDPESDDPDGTFLLLVAPSVQVDPNLVIRKDLIFVLDQSGSMEGEKFRQAQDALSFILDHLNPGDRFNIISFSTGLRIYADELRDQEEAVEAKFWVDSLSAAGSTDINRALLEAMAMVDSERPTTLIFLTDGLPTEGVTDTQMILENLRRAAPGNLSLFAFGVGYDVDTFLLDSLAQENHGTSSYVTPGQPLDEAVSGFYQKVSTPVLTNLQLDFGDAVVYDLYPDPLPDLFAGGQLVLLGRYREPATLDIRLTGEVNGEQQTFVYEGRRLRGTGGSEFLPRLWATRKIGSLLNQVRLDGPQQELVDQIVKLSIRYGIVTPYTSYLVTEPNALGQSAQEQMAREAFSDIMATPAPVSGEAAVQRAADEGEIMQAEIAVAPESEVVQVLGSRTFRLIEGVWIDTAFDPEIDQTLKVPFLSDDYFELASAGKDFGSAMALGQHVIVVVDGMAYEIVGSDDRGDVLNVPAPDEPSPLIDTVTDDTSAGPCLTPFLGLMAPLAGFGRRLRSRKDH